MSINYNKCKEMADFWGAISEGLSNCINYMRNDNYSDDKEYVDVVCSLLISVHQLCDHRIKVLNEKREALEKLAGGAE